MKNPPDIAVIIPTCDRRNMIIDAINSVQNQTLRPTIIYICDNGVSHIETNIPQNAANIKIVHLKLAPRIGASAARNEALRLCSTKFVAFLDDDDLWHSDFLLNSYNFLIYHQVDCTYGSKYIKQHGLIKPYKCVKDSDLNIFTLLRSNPGVGGINLFIKTETIKQINGFDISLPRANDRSLAIDLLLNKFKLKSCESAVSIMNNHNESRLRKNKIGLIHFYIKYRKLFPIHSFLFFIIKTFVSSLKYNFK